MPFEIKVSRRALLAEMGFASTVAERRTTIPALSYVMLSALKTDSQSALRITASDIEQTSVALCRAEVITAGTVLVHARRFYDFLRHLPDGDVHISGEANEWVSIRAAHNRTRMTSMSADSYPKTPSFPKEMGELPTQVLRRLTSSVAFAIPTEAARYTVNGAKLITSDSAITMVATDGHRLSLAADAVAYTAAPAQPVIARKTLQVLRQMIDMGEETAVMFGMDDTHLFFRYGSRALISRKLTGAFPDFTRVLPTSNGKPIRLPRKDLFLSLARVSQFTTGESRTVRVGVSEGEFVVSSTSDDGVSEERITLQEPHEEVTAQFNAGYLMEYLSSIEHSSEVNFEINPGAAPSMLYPHPAQEGSKALYVVMPCRG